jgi:hypothetical protein
MDRINIDFLTEDQFQTWESVGETNDDITEELIIRVKEGQTGKDIADYILELQAAIPRMERIITDLLIRLKKCEECLE